MKATNDAQPPTADISANMLSVLIADDHRMIGEVIAQFLTASNGFDVDLAENLDQTLDMIGGENAYDIVMLDLIMPGMVGTDGIHKVVKACKTGKVVLFSSKVDRFTLDRALEIGVKGIIPKTMPARSLISALNLIHSGEIFLPSNMVVTLKEADRKADSLTETELFILQLAAKGLTNKQIANDIGQSEASIKMFMRSICSKLDARNRAHAAMIGRDLSLLDN